MKHHPHAPVRAGIAASALAAVIASMAWAAMTLAPSGTDTTGTTATGQGAGSTQDSWAERKRDSIRQNEGDTSFYYAMTTPARGPTVGGNRDAIAAFAMTQPIGALSALPASGDPVRGTFSPVIPWPLVGLHAVLTADGRVLSYGTKTDGIQTGYYVYDVWDPQLGLDLSAHRTLPNTTAVDLFCNAQQLLPSGDIEMYGGDILLLPQGFSANKGNDDSNLFRGADDSLIRTADMYRKRWYATATLLPNGEVYVQGGDGGKDLPELRTSNGSFRLLTGADTYYLASYYPRNFVAPDGKIFGVAYNQMYRVDPSGNGLLTRVGKFPANSGGSSTAVMIRPGRILQVGGGPDNTTATLQAFMIDINSFTPVVTNLPQVSFRRHWPNITVMADGRAFLSGGSTTNNNPANGVAYTSEIYNPTTNTWSLGATAKQMRLYHSTSLLLPDATVLTLGGGALGGGNPGPQLNLNGEIYYPPYLFNADGTPAARPIISTAPMSVAPATKFRIGTPNPSAISRITLIKSGSVTHSFDMDQRFSELPFTVVGGELEATLPANIYETPPGYYLVFAINAQGVPSEAAIMRINVAGQTPPPTATLTVRKIVVNDNGGTQTAANFSFSVNGGAPVAFESDGSNVLTVAPGTYNITEPAVAGYAASLSGCSNVVLVAGASATCTITNDDVTTSATLTVRKIVVNDSGGTKAASDFAFSVNGGAPVGFESDGSNALTVPAGTYTITEPSAAGYATSYSGCNGITLAAGGSATCTITNNDIASGNTNLVVNGDFEVNSLAPGTAALVSNLLGWTNTAGQVKLWKGRNGLIAGSGQSNMEIDALITVPNAVYQDIATVAGATYDLTFLQSPRPGYGANSNRFEVWWNGTLLGSFARDGSTLTNASWQQANFVVTGTGNDRLWFKESDADVGGALIDDVRLIAR